MSCEEVKQQFKRNKKLVDFNEIPIDLVQKFYTKYGFEWGMC